jgi:PLP dependent protein
MGVHQVIAVSKLQPVEKIIELYNKGYRHFAENYIQEAMDKIEILKHLDITWHFIGTLQKNKIKYLKNYFAYIHSIESIEQIKVLNQKCEQLGLVQKIFLQVNLSNEDSKSGWSPKDLISEWPKLKDFQFIKIVGLMTMPPLENDPEKNRIYFRNLAQIAKKLNLPELSMGTSGDYKIALEEGSTWVRLGTALFGERTKK